LIIRVRTAIENSAFGRICQWRADRIIAECSMLNAQCSMLDAQCSMLNAQCSMLN
jgi:hypothetical protein